MALGLRLIVTLALVSGAVVSGATVRVNEEFIDFKDEFVDFMSIQMEEAVKLYDLPNLPELATQLGLNDLVKSVVKAGLAKTLSSTGPFTVFGPTDKAFGNIPKWLARLLKRNSTLAGLLKYHVLAKEVYSKDITDELMVDSVQGKPIRFNKYPNKKITAQCAVIDTTEVDQKASNGVLHELEAVMIPPRGDLVKSLSGCPVFKTLVVAVKAAGLVETLSGEGPFTVFAPTDKAFAKIPKETLDNLLKNKTALTEVLTYHVVSKTYCSAGLVGYTSLQTLNGKNVTISLAGKGVKVDDATVIVADGSVTNGVVHAIDSVLLPPAFRRRSGFV